MGQIIPPGYGTQVVVLVKPFPGFRFGITPFLTHTRMRLSMVVVGKHFGIFAYGGLAVEFQPLNC